MDRNFKDAAITAAKKASKDHSIFIRCSYSTLYRRVVIKGGDVWGRWEVYADQDGVGITGRCTNETRLIERAVWDAINA